MTSNMTSHATIGNSTFAEPRSAGTTMSSISGPSDFTEDMFDHMKSNKESMVKTSAKVHPAVKPKRKHHLEPDETGIVIESPSEFNDDLTDFMIRDKAMSSPAKSDKFDLDGPSDFTANIVHHMKGTDFDLDGPSDFTANISQYMKGTKAYSPTAKASPKAFTPVKTPIAKSPKANGKKASPSSPKTLKQNAGSMAAKDTSPNQSAFGHKLQKGYLSSARASATPRMSPEQNLTSISNQTVSQNGKTHVVGKDVIQVSATKGLTDKFAVNKSAVKKGIKPTPHQLKKDALNGSEISSCPGIALTGQTPNVTPKPLPRLNKNLIVTCPSDPTNLTASLAAFINGTAMPTASVHTTLKSTRTMRPMSSPARGENLDGNLRPDFAAELAKYVNGTIKQSSAIDTLSAIDKDVELSVPALETPPVSTKATRSRSSTTSNDSGIEGPTDFTENLGRYMKGTKTHSPHATATAPATLAATGNATESLDKKSNHADEEDLRAQIAMLQAQLVQKDDVVNGLQTSLATSNRMFANLQLEAKKKDDAITTLQTSLATSNRMFANLQLEAKKKDDAFTALQTSLSASYQMSANLQLEAKKKDDAITALQTSLSASYQTSADLHLEAQKKDATITALQTSLSTSHQTCTSSQLRATKQDATIHALQTSLTALTADKQQLEDRAERREEEWHARADLLLAEVDRRGAACLQLWGQMEHPGERDGEGRQKYTYKFVKKGGRGAAGV